MKHDEAFSIFFLQLDAQRCCGCLGTDSDITRLARIEPWGTALPTAPQGKKRKTIEYARGLTKLSPTRPAAPSWVRGAPRPTRRCRRRRPRRTRSATCACQPCRAARVPSRCPTVSGRPRRDTTRRLRSRSSQGKFPFSRERRILHCSASLSTLSLQRLRDTHSPPCFEKHCPSASNSAFQGTPATTRTVFFWGWYSIVPGLARPRLIVPPDRVVSWAKGGTSVRDREHDRDGVRSLVFLCTPARALLPLVFCFPPSSPF